MHNLAIALAFLGLFVVIAIGCLMVGVGFVAVYLLSGLFGPRQPENLNLNAPEPTEAEFNTQE
jgi:hypothetical protein